MSLRPAALDPAERPQAAIRSTAGRFCLTGSVLGSLLTSVRSRISFASLDVAMLHGHVTAGAGCCRRQLARSDAHHISGTGFCCKACCLVPSFIAGVPSIGMTSWRMWR